jgi:hypothetical protein
VPRFPRLSIDGSPSRERRGQNLIAIATSTRIGLCHGGKNCDKKHGAGLRDTRQAIDGQHELAATGPQDDLAIPRTISHISSERSDRLLRLSTDAERAFREVEHIHSSAKDVAGASDQMATPGKPGLTNQAKGTV